MNARQGACPECGGRGWVWYYFWFPQCPECEGTGRRGRRWPEYKPKPMGVVTTPRRVDNTDFDETVTGPTIAELIKAGKLAGIKMTDNDNP